ncbi:MAG: hypothetical protein DRI44_06550 [Chlamydiae bacterium]|nr:MAG: hypothetical protein DRI44_06550 [Chlamydiota bacterium]
MNKSWLEEVRLISSSRRSRTLGAYELAPLVDVILMLVIFSLMVTGFIYTPGIQVDLPAVSNPNAIHGRLFSVTITKNEQIYIKNSTTPVSSMDDLISQLKKFAEQTRDGIVVLKADSKVQHGFLMKLTENIRAAGVRKIAFETYKK